MPRNPGHDGKEVQRRNSAENVSFNVRFDKDDLELLALLLELEIETKDYPSDRLKNMQETVRRLRKRNKETLDELKG